MLAGLANGPRAAHHCFILLRGNGMAAAGTSTHFCRDGGNMRQNFANYAQRF